MWPWIDRSTWTQLLWERKKSLDSVLLPSLWLRKRPSQRRNTETSPANQRRNPSSPDPNHNNHCFLQVCAVIASCLCVCVCVYGTATDTKLSWQSFFVHIYTQRMLTRFVRQHSLVTVATTPTVYSRQWWTWWNKGTVQRSTRGLAWKKSWLRLTLLTSEPTCDCG